jgi:hypothetical protein
MGMFAVNILYNRLRADDLSEGMKYMSKHRLILGCTFYHCIHSVLTKTVCLGTTNMLMRGHDEEEQEVTTVNSGFIKDRVRRLKQIVLEIGVDYQ